MPVTFFGRWRWSCIIFTSVTFGMTIDIFVTLAPSDSSHTQSFLPACLLWSLGLCTRWTGSHLDIKPENLLIVDKGTPEPLIKLAVMSDNTSLLCDQSLSSLRFASLPPLTLSLSC